MSVSSSYTEPRQPRWPGASQRRDHPARIDDDVLGLASDFMVVSSHAVAGGGLAAGPDERGRDHCRAARGEFTAHVVQVSVSRYRVSWIGKVIHRQQSS